MLGVAHLINVNNTSSVLSTIAPTNCFLFVIFDSFNFMFYPLVNINLCFFKGENHCFEFSCIKICDGIRQFSR